MNPAVSNILMIVLLVVIFYFFIIRPQTKRQKQLQKSREALKVGDKVVTSGGIYGIVKDVNTATKIVVIEVWEGVRLKIALDSLYSLEDAEKRAQ